MKCKFLISVLLLLVISACSKEEVINMSVNNEETSNIDFTVNQKSTGTSSNDLLSDNIFKSMVVEVVYIEGFEPTQNAIDNFVSFLEARTYKPDGIVVEKRAIPSPGNTKYSIQNIIEIEDTNRNKYNTNNQIAVWAFFTDGESDKNSENSFVL